MCSTWRSEIPKILADDCLQEQTTITFDCGEGHFEGRVFPLSLSMVFEQFDKSDGRRCVFGEGPFASAIGFSSVVWPSWLYVQAEVEEERQTRAQWAKRVRFYQGYGKNLSSSGRPGANKGRPRFNYPLYQICINGRALDTELPGLRFDLEKKRFSFEWEGMLTHFYREQTEVNRRQRDNLDKLLRARSAGDKETINKLLADFNWEGVDKTSSLEVKSKVLETYRREVRRERIRRWFRDHDGAILSDEQVKQWETLALKNGIEAERRAMEEERMLDYEDDDDDEEGSSSLEDDDAISAAGDSDIDDKE
ncbi:hypothetical protein LTR85_002369 [Meristemomyces frigidus]|nr:hypothetical protein LTR85_002369 [Meristemomyces frigidus]